MVRLRNVRSGVVVNVDGDTAARLGSEWEPVGTPKKSTKAAPKRRTSSSVKKQ